MVNVVANPFTRTNPNRIPTVPEKAAPDVVSEKRTNCPRCTSILRLNYEELECLQCGYVDYSYVHERSVKPGNSIISTGTRFILRYVGDFPKLVNTLAHVKLHRIRNRIAYGVSCPFCGRAMSQSSLSGKRREIREERYKCASGHRVSLTPSIDGGLGWK